jgi:hypothetical protein
VPIGGCAPPRQTLRLCGEIPARGIWHYSHAEVITDVLAAVATIGGRVVGQVIEGQARYPLQIDRKTLYRKLEEPEPAEQLPPSNKAD